MQQSDMESMRDAQAKFLEQLLGNRIHLLTGSIQLETVSRNCESWVGISGSKPLSYLE
jgi:hypothetical protein